MCFFGFNFCLRLAVAPFFFFDNSDGYLGVTAEPLAEIFDASGKIFFLGFPEEEQFELHVVYGSAPGFFLLFLKYLCEFALKSSIVGKPDPGAGVLDGGKIGRVGENARVKRPLAAAPWAGRVDGATVMVEDAMSVFNLHLDYLAGYPKIFFNYFFFVYLEIGDHASKVFGVKRHGGFTMTAMAAATALKDFLIQLALLDQSADGRAVIPY